MASSQSPSRAQRINDYLHRKQELIEQLNKGFSPIVRALLRELAGELRLCRPGMPDALLIEMHFSGVGIEDETRTRCEGICQHYGEHHGLGVRQHHLQLAGEDAIVTLEIELRSALQRLVVDCLGGPIPLTIRVQLHSADNGVQDIAVTSIEKLDLADLEVLHAALTRCWGSQVDAGMSVPDAAADRSTRHTSRD